MDEREFLCPYCGSLNIISLENQSRQYELVMDCETCCKPIAVRVRMVGGSSELEVRGENE